MTSRGTDCFRDTDCPLAGAIQITGLGGFIYIVAAARVPMLAERADHGTPVGFSSAALDPHEVHGQEVGDDEERQTRMIVKLQRLIISDQPSGCCFMPDQSTQVPGARCSTLASSKTPLE